MKKEKHETWIHMATYGKKVRLNLKRFVEKPGVKKKGIVIYEIKEQKKELK